MEHEPVSAVRIEVPQWAWSMVAARSVGVDPEAQMHLVLDLVERNISDGGGPFAAAIFADDGTVIAPGVNRVVADSAPVAHAEMVAIAAATQSLANWDLRSVGRFRLVSSTEPCAMCMGAVPWSGVSSLVIGARDADARACGFDEGSKPDDWIGDLERRGIEVTTDVGRERSAALLSAYGEAGGEIYNGAPS